MEIKRRYTIRYSTSTNENDVEITEDKFFKLENNLLLGNISHKTQTERHFYSGCLDEHMIIEFDTNYSLLYAIRESIK